MGYEQSRGLLQGPADGGNMHRLKWPLGLAESSPDGVCQRWPARERSEGASLLHFGRQPLDSSG